MSVLLETSLGDIVIDLYTAQAPLTSSNFLKLCLVKYYNSCTFHTILPNLYIQTGDPTNTGSGGSSIHHLLGQGRFIADELGRGLSHAKKGTVSMVNLGVKDTNASQFFITTVDGLQSLDEKHTIFGRVAEGMDVVERINAQPVNDKGRPVVHVRIRHTTVLEDPFPSPPELLAMVPPQSPPPTIDPYDYESIQQSTLPTPSSPTASNPAALALNPHAVVLEMIGDLPSASVAPPENVLFVCKLNPVTQADDLALIFSRFGHIVDCSVIKGPDGQSLCYAFIEFETKEQCEAAYVKMDGVVVDDRRIKVDFSQSVSKQWRSFRQGKAGMGKGGGRGGRQGGGYAAGRELVGGSTTRGAQNREGNRPSASRWGERSDASERKESEREERHERVSREDERRDEKPRSDSRDEDRSRGRDRDRGRDRTREHSKRRHHRSRSRSRSRERSHPSSHHKHRHRSRSRSRSPRR